MTVIAIDFEKQSGDAVSPVPVHAAAGLLDLGKLAMPSRHRKTTDAAVLWVALKEFHDTKFCATAFASAADVSDSTLAKASKQLSDDVKFMTALHWEMYKLSMAAQDSERKVSREPEPLSRGTKRGREEGITAQTPSAPSASGAALLAGDPVPFPVKKKICAERSQLADGQTAIQTPPATCHLYSGQLQLLWVV